LVTITSLLYAVLNLSILPVGPYAGQFLLNLGIGAILGAVYVRWDFLSAAIAQFLFIFGLTALAGWSAPGSGEVWMFVSFAVLSLALLVLGFSAALNGKDPSELGRYEPDYIEDLAMEQRMRQELTIAKQVQESFLPIRLPSFGRADIYARCRSAYETGGDYYDFFPLADRRLGVIIGDVSGKGIQAAFFMTFIKGVLHALAGSHDSTKDVLWNANALFQRNAPKGTFITLIYGILDLDVMEFRFTRAGHNPLILIRPSNGSIEEIRSEGLGVGMSNQSDFAKHTHEQHLAVSSGDLLVLYTDGIVEAMNEKGEPYGEEALKSMLIRNAGESSKEITARVFEDVQRFTSDAKQHDDMTMVVIRVP
jgi:sigma-B regulation protein RsbU (phosphoserine phosphatase)